MMVVVKGEIKRRRARCPEYLVGEFKYSFCRQGNPARIRIAVATGYPKPRSDEGIRY